MGDLAINWRYGWLNVEEHVGCCPRSDQVADTKFEDGAQTSFIFNTELRALLGPTVRIRGGTSAWRCLRNSVLYNYSKENKRF